MARPNFIAAQTLLTIERLGTFTAAAEALNTTQSAISARMRDLENSLGYKLFIKSGRRLQLTIAARELVTRIKPLIEQLEQAFSEAEAEDDPRGTIRIGLAEVAVPWFSRQLQVLHKRFPRLQFAIEVDFTRTIGDALEAGTLDIGIVATPPASSMLRYSLLGRTPLNWYCAASLIKGQEGDEPELQELLREQLLWSVPKMSPSHGWARSELVKMGGDLRNLCTTNKGLLDIALAGGGIVLLPDTMAQQYWEAGQLKRLSNDLEQNEIELFLTISGSQRQTAVLQLDAALRDMVAQSPP